MLDRLGFLVLSRAKDDKKELLFEVMSDQPLTRSEILELLPDQNIHTVSSNLHQMQHNIPLLKYAKRYYSRCDDVLGMTYNQAINFRKGITNGE